MPKRMNYHIDYSVFEPPLSPQAEYWIGFLLADGGVSTNYTLQLTLKAADRRHLEKFAAFMKATSPIYDVPRSKTVTIRLVSKRLCASVGRLGILPRKSLAEVAHPTLQDSQHFWRGVIDGDGHVGFDRLRLVGGRSLLVQWQGFCRSLVSHDLRITASFGKNKPFFLAGIYGPKMRTILRALYCDAPWEARLERKFETAMQVLVAPRGRGNT